MWGSSAQPNAVRLCPARSPLPSWIRDACLKCFAMCPSGRQESTPGRGQALSEDPPGCARIALRNRM
eukprot:3729049-Alexandrium_andersonii.AAC.1